MKQISLRNKQSPIHKLSIEPYGLEFMLNLLSIQAASKEEVRIRSDDFFISDSGSSMILLLGFSNLNKIGKTSLNIDSQ